MRITSIVKDDRLDAHSVMMEMTIGDYLDFVVGAERNLEIQRKVVKGFKPYDRLREDLDKGCLIPPLVLALKEGVLQSPGSLDDQIFLTGLQELNRDCVYIVDGLQRTNAIRLVVRQKEQETTDTSSFLARIIRVEIWPDITLSALTYRMILLNAGQKPMSLQHQLEVVSSALCMRLLETFNGQINIYREQDADRRAGPGQYQFSLLAQSFQAFVQRKPHIDVRNEVISELSQMEALEVYGNTLRKHDGEESSPTAQFFNYISFLLMLDNELCRIYPDARAFPDAKAVGSPSGITLLARDTFHLGLAAAYAWSKEYKPDALTQAVDRLFNLLQDANPPQDPLALEIYEQIQKGFKRKDNVGEATRNLVFNGFREFFRAEGLMTFKTCWTQAG